MNVRSSTPRSNFMYKTDLIHNPSLLNAVYDYNPHTHIHTHAIPRTAQSPTHIVEMCYARRCIHFSFVKEMYV